MSARGAVLGAVRGALGREPGRPAPRTGLVPRDYRTEAGVVSGSGEAVDLLVERLVDYHATVVRCTPATLSAAITHQFTETGAVALPPGLPQQWADAVAASGATVVPDDPDAPLAPGALDRCDAVLTACRVAVADTGTIVVDGEPDQGRRVLTLLPDRHVCVVRQDQLVGSVPEAVRLLERHPERPLTWISGPSATSDIELVRVEGVHGPRALSVIVVSAED